MVKVEMDENIAQAINNISTAMPEDWALMQHYIALKLIKTRDEMELVNSDRLSGYCQGLRFLFELWPRAICKINNETWSRDKWIRGEVGFVVKPLSDD